ADVVEADSGLGKESGVAVIVQKTLSGREAGLFVADNLAGVVDGVGGAELARADIEVIDRAILIDEGFLLRLADDVAEVVEAVEKAEVFLPFGDVKRRRLVALMQEDGGRRELGCREDLTDDQAPIVDGVSFADGEWIGQDGQLAVLPEHGPAIRGIRSGIAHDL